MKPILRFGLAIARTSMGRRIYRWIFSSTKLKIPVSHLRDTKNVMAYFHPDPSYPFHVLIVPRRPIESIMHIDHTDSTCLIEVFDIVKSLVEEYQLSERGFRVIVNGGNFQKIPQLHFHLVAETAPMR